MGADMFGCFIKLHRAVEMGRVRQVAIAFAAVMLFGGLFCQGAVADGTEKKTTKAADGAGDLTWAGWGFGLGIAVDFDVGGRRVGDIKVVGPDNIVRVGSTSGNANVG